MLRDTLSILLEGTPSTLNYDTVYSDLLGLQDVVSVRRLHLWSLTSDIPVISVHLTSRTDSDHQRIRTEANRWTLASRLQLRLKVVSISGC